MRAANPRHARLADAGVRQRVTMTAPDGLPIHEFRTSDELRAWLEDHHDSSKGMWLRIYKKNSGIQSVTFEQVLDEGLALGGAKAKGSAMIKNHTFNGLPHARLSGSQSPRNLARAQLLVEKGKMKPSGLRFLGVS